MAGWGEDSRTGRQTREAGADEVPWFDHLRPTHASPGFEAWVMEFLEDPTDLQIRESAFTDWLAGSTYQRPRPTLSDLSLVQLTIPADGIAATAPVLRAAGVEIDFTPDLVVARTPRPRSSCRPSGPS